MDALFEMRDKAKSLKETMVELSASLDVDGLREEVSEMEQKSFAPDFWDDSDAAGRLMTEMNNKKSKVELSDELHESLDNLIEMFDLVEEEDTEMVADLKAVLIEDEKKVSAFRLETLLNGEYDGNNCILSIHAGAGGTEATDWAQMLLRMYTRYFENKGWKYEITDINDEEAGGIKSATVMVKGQNTYGYLKGEKGVHRLVRISPFDSSARRHTSFTSVDVFPELDDSVEIEIDPSDLRIDTYRSSGKGGQHVNTTDSAVRITHIPTGVVAQCQAERSQIQNRDKAMRMLIAKLTQIQLEENKERIEDIQGSYTQIAWGSQIRSYVFQPYQMVKDHRTEEETGNVQKVMDGDLDPFVNAYLNWYAQKD